MSNEPGERARLARYYADQARADLAAYRKRCCEHSVPYSRCAVCKDPDEVETCERHGVEYAAVAGCPACRTEKEQAQ